MTAIISDHAQPLVKIRPSSGWAALNLSEVWQFRDLMLTLAARDLKVRYKQTLLGGVWVVLQPLMAAGAFTFVFGKVAKMPSDDQPYIVFAFSGLLAWNAFTSVLMKTSNSMLGNTHLISKVYFPRMVLPLSGVLTTIVDFLIAFVLMAVLMVVYHVKPGFPLLMLPFWLVMLSFSAMGLGLAAASFTIEFRDISYVLPMAIQFLMYISPVAYAVSAVPSSLKGLYKVNPIVGYLEAFRWSIYKGDLHFGSLLYSFIFSIATFFLGALLFKRNEWKFVDVL